MSFLHTEQFYPNFSKLGKREIAISEVGKLQQKNKLVALLPGKQAPAALIYSSSKRIRLAGRLKFLKIVVAIKNQC